MGKAWAGSEVTESAEPPSEPLEFTSGSLEISHCSSAFPGAAQAVSGHHSWLAGTGPQLSQGTGFTHTTTATKLSGPAGHYHYSSCSFLHGFPAAPLHSSHPPLPPYGWVCIVQKPQESSWLIHHPPHGAGAPPCQTLCQDENFTRVRHTSVSWFHLLGWAFRGRWQRAPLFGKKETCCRTLLLNHLFLKAMFSLPLPWWGQPWILESTVLTYFMQFAWSLFVYHRGVLLVESSYTQQLHTAAVSMKKTRETRAFLKYQCNPFGVGLLPWDVLKLEKCPETESSMFHHMGLMPPRGSSMSSFARQISLRMFPKQVPSERERVWKKDEDRQMSSSSLLICSSTALLINVCMSVKQRDCTLFCKVMWKYL